MEEEKKEKRYFEIIQVQEITKVQQINANEIKIFANKELKIVTEDKYNCR